MSLAEKVKKIANDLATLEVATLTKVGSNLSLEKELKDAEKAELDRLTEAINTAHQELKDLREAEPPASQTDIDSAIDNLNNAQKELREKQESFGVFNPKDTFGIIKSQLVNTDLVAYSRFELEGDSLNYISSNENLQGLVDQHKNMVEAAQASRTAFFDTVGRAINKLLP
ncbi:MAG: hypothetical protein JXR03_18420 [Cyclobacteriaceae bacterium]